VTSDIRDPRSGLALEDLRTLAYAAAFVRRAPGIAGSIEVTLPSLDHDASWALERACRLAVNEGPLEAEITFALGATTVRFARPGCL
jgi:hypothetical protein